MPPNKSVFSDEELNEVLSRYDLGQIRKSSPLSAGSRRASKMVVISDRGKFLLKRRLVTKENLDRAHFAHAVQKHLAQKGFPVTVLQDLSDEDDTLLQLNNYVYELFEFVTGVRYDGTPEATAEAGRQLAAFHSDLSNFSGFTEAERVGFHDSAGVRRHLKTIESEMRSFSDTELPKTIDALMSLYNKCSTAVNSQGFDSWPRQVIHGDWHPGNMLFNKGKLVAVLDFDSIKIAPSVTDLANGILQFSIVGNRPNPADWPAYLDQSRFIQFLSGYREIIKLDKNQIAALFDLMIETMIAEAVLPIATTGFFGNLGGTDFLKMIHRKAQWISDNRKTLTEAIHD